MLRTSSLKNKSYKAYAIMATLHEHAYAASLYTIWCTCMVGQMLTCCHMADMQSAWLQLLS